MVKRLVINDSSVTVPTTNLVIAEEVYGSIRKVLVLTNTSTAGEIISIAIGTEAVAGEGIVLGQGASYVASTDGNYNPPNTRVNALASVNTATLAIHEEIQLDEEQ